MSWYTCSDCDYMNLRDKNSYGEAYCSERKHYYNPSDTICNRSSIKGRDVGGSSSCYLTTAMCDILGYEDDCSALKTLRFLRDSYMKKEVDCYDLLKEYNQFGPDICESLYQDKNRKIVVLTMLKHYIEPAIKMINNNQYDNAIDIYIEMTNTLINKYDIDTTKQRPIVRYQFYR